MSQHLIIIDASSFIHRAFHAIKPRYREHDGVNINCVVGFSEMLFSIQRTSIAGNRPRPATHMVAVFDHKSPNFRHKLDPNYKANRPPIADDLRIQFPMVRHACKAHNVLQIEMEGHEADDIIATICKRTPETEIEIFTSDKDLCSLVSPYVTIWNPMSRKVMDANAVFEKFGVWPSEIRDFLAMVGDTVDNIPGIPGVGEKTAASLIGQFGTIEDMVCRVGEVEREKIRVAIEQNIAQLSLAQKLTTLDEEVPVLWDMEAAEIKAPQKLAILAFCKAHGMKSHLADVLRFIELRKRYGS